MFRRFVTSALTVLISAGFAGSVYAADILRVGSEATYPPFEFVDDNGETQGYDMDIIRAIGEVMGYEVQILKMGFDALIPALMGGQIDAAISAMTITPERAQRVDFSKSYYQSGLSVLIHEQDLDKFPNLEALKGQVICAQIGTTGAMKADDVASGGQVKTFNTAPEAYMELKANGCAAVINDRPVNLFFLNSQASDGIIEMSEMISSEDYGIAVAKGNDRIKRVIDEGLAKIRENGTFDKIYNKWFSVAE